MEIDETGTPDTASRWRYYLLGSTPDVRFREWVEADISEGRAGWRQSLLIAAGVVAAGLLAYLVTGRGVGRLIGLLILPFIAIPLNRALYERWSKARELKRHQRRWRRRSSHT